MIHMKCQVLFSLKNNKEKLTISSATIFACFLRAKQIDRANNLMG